MKKIPLKRSEQTCQINVQTTLSGTMFVKNEYIDKKMFTKQF